MHQLVIIVAKYGIAIPIVAMLYVAIRCPKEQRARLLLCAIMSGVSALLLVKLATTLYHDPRPFITDGIKPYFASSTDNGFPSDHTVLSAILALLGLGISKKLGLGLMVIAIAIGTARVIAGVHHTQDVVGALLIAGISYGLTIWAVQYLKFHPSDNTHIKKA